MTDWDAPPLAFSSDEVELLARMEHDRWCREYDRNTVRAMPAFLTEAGFAVVRVGQAGRDGG